VDGPFKGRTSRQPDGCDAWDYDGFELDNLPVGMTVMLRASAPGYRSEKGQATARNSAGPVHFVLVPE
jgi:hypothetical protein